MPPPLLPGFYRFLDSFLPAGAAVETIRNAVYFRDAQHLEPILVLAGWTVCLLTVLVLAARYGGRAPGGPVSTQMHAGSVSPERAPPSAS